MSDRLHNYMEVLEQVFVVLGTLKRAQLAPQEDIVLAEFGGHYNALPDPGDPGLDGVCKDQSKQYGHDVGVGGAQPEDGATREGRRPTGTRPKVVLQVLPDRGRNCNDADTSKGFRNGKKSSAESPSTGHGYGEGEANPRGPIPTETRTDQEQYDCGDLDGAGKGRATGDDCAGRDGDSGIHGKGERQGQVLKETPTGDKDRVYHHHGRPGTRHQHRDQARDMDTRGGTKRDFGTDDGHQRGNEQVAGKIKTGSSSKFTHCIGGKETTITQSTDRGSRNRSIESSPEQEQEVINLEQSRDSTSSATNTDEAWEMLEQVPLTDETLSLPDPVSIHNY